MSRLFDTIMQNFKSTQRTSQRYLGVGFVFTLLCFFYVVEPFFIYTSNQDEAEETLEQIQASMETSEKQLKEISSVNDQAQKTLVNLEQRIRNYPDHLNQEVLPQLYAQFYGEDGRYERENYNPQQMQQQVQSSGRNEQIWIPSDITEYSDAVNWYVQSWFQAIVDDLNSGITDPISGLEVFENEQQVNELKSLTRQAVDEINSHLNTIDPDFWHTYQEGKVETVGELQRVIDQSFEPVREQLDNMHGEISVSIEDLKASQDELNTEKEAIQENISLLNDRIRSMSTPFGPIPLRATEIITLFPVLLVLIVLFTALSLAKSARLYTELWETFSEDGERSVRDFKLFTDCWYLPPYRSKIQPVLLILYVIILTGIFIYSWYLVATEPVLFSFPGLGEESLRRILFMVLYFIGFLVIISSVWLGYKKLNEIPEFS